jgi:hypothetical protein
MIATGPTGPVTSGTTLVHELALVRIVLRLLI